MQSSLRLAFAVAAACMAAAASPRIFYSDLESAPKMGGENNAGAFVTIYGAGFGPKQNGSYVTVGHGKAAGYPVWTDTKVTFQLGSAATTGDIVVTTGEGASNSIPFTVRPGKLYFVAVNGSDSANGSFHAPWRTLPHAVQTIKNGDIIYGRDGVAQTVEDGQGWRAAITLRIQWCGGTGYPRALLAYPGANVTVGSATAPSLLSFRSTDASGDGACAGNWVFGGLKIFSTGAMMLAGGNNWRIVGNEFSCPNGDGAGACFETSNASNVKFFGNYVHNAGKQGASALYHGVYFSTDSNHIDMGWNIIADIRGCRGVQIHSSPAGPGGAADPTGHNQYDISIHDNVIHDTQCDGIVLSTVDPSKGPVKVYNNLIYNAGKGPDNPERRGSWTCISVQGHTNNGTPGGGTVDIYSNTFYNCGSFAKPPYQGSNAGVMNGGENRSLFLSIRNNIFYQTTATPYVVDYVSVKGADCMNTDCKGIQGRNNLFFGAGPAPRSRLITGSFNSDPAFVNAGKWDFHLSGRSPARRAGAPVPLGADIEGNPRGEAGAYDLGAFQSAIPNKPS